MNPIRMRTFARASLIFGAGCCLALPACFDPSDPEDTDASTLGSSGGDDGGPTSAATSSPTTDPDTTGDPTTDPDTTTGDPTDATTTGPALEPEIEVSIEGQPIADGEAYMIEPTADVGAMGASVTVTIANTGDGDLAIASVTEQGVDADDFAVDDGSLSQVVAPGDSTTVSVTFTPTRGGLRTLQLAIASDDADESDYTVDVRGHTTPNTWRMLSPATNPSGRFNAGMDALPDGRMVLFAGRDAAGAVLSDTWIFDPQTNAWTQSTPAMSPPPRFAHALAWGGGENVIVFGGSPGQGMVGLADTWRFDAGTEQWSPVPGAGPPGRFQHGMVAVGDGELIMVGGRPGPGSGGDLGDTWGYSAATQTWTNLAPLGPVTARSSFAMAFDGDDRVTIFGGFTGTTPLGLTNRYGVVGNLWASVAAAGTSPGARAVLLGSTLLDGRMLVFSGKLGDCCIDPTGGTFAYDPIAETWEDLAPGGEPTPRFNYAMATNPGRNQIIVFGGLLQNTGVNTAQSDTWEYVGPLPPPA